VGKAKGGGFVTISQNHGLFAVQGKVFLVFFLFNGLDFTNLLFIETLVEEVSNEDGLSKHEATLGLDQVFTSNTEDSFAGGGDLYTRGSVLVGNNTRFVALFNLGKAEGFTVVLNHGVLVEAFGARLVLGGDSRVGDLVAAIVVGSSGSDVARRGAVNETVTVDGLVSTGDDSRTGTSNEVASRIVEAGSIGEGLEGNDGSRAVSRGVAGENNRASRQVSWEARLGASNCDARASEAGRATSDGCTRSTGRGDRECNVGNAVRGTVSSAAIDSHDIVGLGEDSKEQGENQGEHGSKVGFIYLL